MLRFITLIDTVSDRVGKIFSFCIPIITAIVCYEVVMRYAFNRPTQWAHETSGYLFVVCLMFGGSYALLHGAHVRVDILFARLSPRGQAIADIVLSPFIFLIAATLVWVGWEGTLDSVRFLERSQTSWGPPLYPSKVLVMVAIFMFALQLASNFIRSIYKAARGKADEH